MRVWAASVCGAKHRKAAQAGLWHAVKRESEASRAPASSVWMVQRHRQWGSASRVPARLSERCAGTEWQVPLWASVAVAASEWAPPCLLGLHWNPFDGERNLVNAKNTPVVLVMAIAAFDPGSSVASPVYLHKCTDCRKDIIYTLQTCDKTLLNTAKTGVNCECWMGICATVGVRGVTKRSVSVSVKILLGVCMCVHHM